MSRKIIGVTVGTTLPKPNFKQTDPTKGDYIKNKPDFDGLKSKVNTVENLVGDTAVSEQIASAVAPLASVKTMTTAEYTALESAGTTNANTLYMLTDAEDELIKVSPDQPENPEESPFWFDTDDGTFLEIDNVPTEGSNNFVTSGGVYKAIAENVPEIPENIATQTYVNNKVSAITPASIGAQTKHSATTVVLSASGWSSNTQTITVSGVTGSNTVIVSPDSDSQSLYISSGVYCSAQTANKLTFTCGSVPTIALSVNVAILD